MKEVLGHIDKSFELNPNVSNVFGTRVASTSSFDGRPVVLSKIRSLFQETDNEDFINICSSCGYCFNQ